jgi:hypothetical protein
MPLLVDWLMRKVRDRALNRQAIQVGAGTGNGRADWALVIPI